MMMHAHVDMIIDFLQETNFPHEANTVFKSQEKYVISLGAPTSIAQKHGEDTLTYLNKGMLCSMFLFGGKDRTLDNFNFHCWNMW